MPGKIKLTDEDVLVVIDVQKDFCAGGALAVQNADAVVEPVAASNHESQSVTALALPRVKKLGEFFAADLKKGQIASTHFI